ncbi:hypothetical protein YH65_01515 [Sulfurovum lithotrophicum]|uniref:DUF1501 domain-containing protein n=1 Tax=Sulfurovum lithotrophicum TaxID=206403 RepID=A0A7U4LZQ6_9BACT|nr:DUF1501 domain-containing protein [Sulfurovum lithotrophicum]AKF24219.1 hypothetical protein YH65_01515 [Sulfurovum lithotrophicum]
MKKNIQRPEEHIDRRTFMKGLGALGLSSVFPSTLSAAALDYDQIQFDPNIYNDNNAQTIIVYLTGGAAEFAGNLTNLDEINSASQNPYPLPSMTPTQNNCWLEAGGDSIEKLLANGDMNLFRTCFRTFDDSRSHGVCSSQAQYGQATQGTSGIVTNIASILYNKGAVTEPTANDEIGKNFPFVSMESTISPLYAKGGIDLPSFLEPVIFDSKSAIKNPYARSSSPLINRILNTQTEETIDNLLDTQATQTNTPGTIQDNFDKRAILAQYTDELNAIPLPEGVSYPAHNEYADKLQLAMKLLIHNAHTKVVTIGAIGGLGGWDDHQNALAQYSNRMKQLLSALDAAVTHMNAAARTNINIVVFGEFGRNLNYNNAAGWDHGNNQNVYWIGGKDYMNQMGIVGETELYTTGEPDRLYNRPKNFGQEGESYHFQVFSIAATLYNIYGITNPEILTDNNMPIDGLLS